MFKKKTHTCTLTNFKFTEVWCSVQQDGGGEGGHEGDDPQTAATQTTRSFSALLHSGPGGLHLPSAAVCVGVLPGLCVYSSSSDSDSSSDSEGSVDHPSHHSNTYR